MLTLDVRCRASVKSTGRSGRPKAILWVSICTLVRLQRRSRQLKGRLAMVLLCCALWPQASVLCSMAKNGFRPLTLTHSGFLEASSPENPSVSVSSFLPYRSSVLRVVDLTVLVTSKEMVWGPDSVSCAAENAETLGALGLSPRGLQTAPIQASCCGEGRPFQNPGPTLILRSWCTPSCCNSTDKRTLLSAFILQDFSFPLPKTSRTLSQNSWKPPFFFFTQSQTSYQ